MLESMRSYNNHFKHFLLGFFLCVFAFAKADVPSFKPITSRTPVEPCAFLITPIAGSSGVDVNAIISFNPVPDRFIYEIDLGTVPSGTDVLDNFVTGATSFTPPFGMPENTTIWITIRALADGDPTISCDSQRFTTGAITDPPACSQLRIPADGAVNVGVGTSLAWNYAPRAKGYRINLVSENGTVIIDNEDRGETFEYDFPGLLEPNTIYFATVSPYNGIAPDPDCIETSFTTESFDTTPPGCSQLITPSNGAEGVALSPTLEWTPVGNARGYYITVGTTPTNADVLDRARFLAPRTMTDVIDFIEDTDYYVTVIPFNDAGEATGCIQTTFTTTQGCGPYIDDITGELVDLNPIINLERRYERCRGDVPLQLNYWNPAFSIAWYRMADFEEVKFSTDSTVSIEDPGMYRLEVIIEEAVEAGTIFCSSSHSFEVVVSEKPTIESIRFVNQGLTAAVTITASGIGDYEYASNLNGPYQTSPILSNLDFSNISVYARDRNGCGVAEKTIRPDLGFPRYFTPNNDGINDTWQVRGAIVNGEKITQIEIFDRFGKLITRIIPEGPGWDGTLSGRRMINQGFWYKASTESSLVFTGQFVLKR